MPRRPLKRTQKVAETRSLGNNIFFIPRGNLVAAEFSSCRFIGLDK